MQTEVGGSNYLPDLELENFTQKRITVRYDLHITQAGDFS